MQEEIIFKNSRTGTTITFFDTHLQPDLAQERYPAYIALDNMGQPYFLTTFDGEIKWANAPVSNVNVNVDDLGIQTISGTAFFQTIDYVLSNQEQLNIRNSFLQTTRTEFSGLSQSYVFFQERLVDDMFVNISLNRTYKTLDTLSIYNNLRNSFPIQESDTGTVFGKLTAIQKIKDLAGNNIKIPLKNVPIGVFAPSSEFPDATSVDNNGNRISLNLLESSSQDEYFNAESFSSDTQSILTSGSQFETVPSHYKYMTYTNEEGEFVIHNVPTGTQTIIFEVDLFKQGLTKDEISLNFFPFPEEEEPNVDSVPSMFFRQFPIDVIPTWGDFQTGYTETNINVNLDLRKWSTFFVPPVTLDGKDVEFLQSRGLSEPFKVQIRDMSKEGFPIRDIELVEIPDIRDRKDNQQLFWRNEFKQLKNRVEIRRKGYQAFKVPANIYDPVGFRTDREGNPTTNKGVWLAAYQFKLFYDDSVQKYRSTGQRKVQLNSDTVVRRDHFHLNYNNNNYELSNSQSQESKLGEFPYEQPWNHLYPEPYSIPALPTQENPDYYEGATASANVLENPRYIDGDRICHPFVGDFRDDGFGGGIGGYGVEKDTSTETGEWYVTDFARYIAKNTLYKYENRGYTLEEYANGYRPNDENFIVQPGVSNVIKGEKYQRTECGYGYYLRPEGWARVATYPWWGPAEATFQKDLDALNSYASPEDASGGGAIVKEGKYNSMAAVSEDSGRKVSLNLGNQIPSQLQEGFLDIYRIVNSNPNENLAKPPFAPREAFVRLYFQFVRVQNAYTSGQNTKFKLDPSRQDMYSLDGSDYNFNVTADSRLEIKNTGVISSTIKVLGGNEITLNAGQTKQFSLAELSLSQWNKLTLECPTNAEFDYEQNYYTRSRYNFRFKNVKFAKNLGGNPNNIKLPRDYNAIENVDFASNLPGESVKRYYLISMSLVKTPTNVFGVHKCSGNRFNGPNRLIIYNGIYFDGNQEPRHLYSYWRPDFAWNQFSCPPYSEASQNFLHL